MKEAIKDTLYRVGVEVLEKIAFVFSFTEDERENMSAGNAVTARVTFSGLFTGSLVMRISDSILPELTGNMLGLDDSEETTREQQHDAVKELINVICGNLLPAIAGKSMVFNVDTPIIVPEDETTDNTNQVSVARLSLEEEGQCDLILYVDGRIPGDDISDSD